MNNGAFYLFEAEDFLGDLHVEDPMHEGNVVARVKPMPKRTHNDSTELCVELPSSLFLFIGVISRVVDVFIDVAAKCNNSADVPMICLDLETRVKVELFHVVHLYLSEIIRDGVVFIVSVQGRIVGDSRGPHADHRQTPGSHILEFQMCDSHEWIQDFVDVVVIIELRLYCPVKIEVGCCKVQSQCQQKHPEFLDHCDESVRDRDVISPTMKIIIEIGVFIRRANQAGGKEVDKPKVGQIVGRVDYPALKLILRELFFRQCAILIVVAQTDIVEQLHHEDRRNIHTIFPIRH